MPEANQTQKTPITFGPCPKCQTLMLLGLIEPDELGHEKRTYRCDSCGVEASGGEAAIPPVKWRGRV